MKLFQNLFFQNAKLLSQLQFTEIQLADARKRIRLEKKLLMSLNKKLVTCDNDLLLTRKTG